MYVGFLNIHGTQVSANNSTTNIVATYLETKTIKTILKIDATHLHDNDLLLREETKKKIAYPGS